MQELIDLLQSLDTRALYAINHGMSNRIFDAIMPQITTTAFWMPIYVIGIVGLLTQGARTWHHGGVRLVTCAVVMMAGILVLDPVGHHLLKEVVGRPRPYLVLPDIHKLIGSGGGSFPSNHAMNNAFIAFILSAWFPRWRTLLWGVALLIMFTRLYCGVHYPSDILGGAVIGASVAFATVHVIGNRWPRCLNAQPPQS
ncbi:MAG: phosphatase PAP2 family protein [Ignavibacteria bacterium]|nr:phosphatase PAP2 family protein [Ignavibacteria bacterium]